MWRIECSFGVLPVVPLDGNTRAAEVSNTGFCRPAKRLLSPEVSAVNLDLSQVEAFVAAADQLHFGRAAARLHLRVVRLGWRR